MQEIANNNYYEIRIDISKNRLYLKIKGLWEDTTQAQNFPKDIQSAVSLLSSGFTILSDGREMKAQKQEIGALHQEAQGIAIKGGLDRTAIVTNSAITKMYADRQAETSGMKKMEFSSVEEAEKWLDSK